MRSLLAHSSLAPDSVVYADDEGFVCVAHADGTLVRIADGQPGPQAPKVFLASSVGLSVSNGPDENVDAFNDWASDVSTSHVLAELFFDETGTYEFDEKLIVPAGRGLRGVSQQFTELRYVGPEELGSETAFINASSSEMWLETLTISCRDGVTSDGLLDYVVATQGTLSPNQAGATLHAHRVLARFAGQACWYALNSAVELSYCNAYAGTGRTCYWFDGCSESSLVICYASVWTEAALRNRGLYAEGTPEVTNGGKLTLVGFVAGTTPAAPYGLDIDGTANCDVTGCTVEGADTAAYYVHGGSTNIHMRGTRSNGGPHAICDDCINVTIEGAGQSGNIPDGAYITSRARNCRVGLVVETDSGHFYMDQLFGSGTTKWVGHRGHIGDRLISKANTAPTDGYFEINDEIIRTAQSGQPEGWRITTNGQPMSSSVTATFTAVGGTADTISRTSGSFMDDGFVPGNAYTVSGSVSNNVTFTIASVTADTITLTAGSPNLTNEGPVAVTLTGTGVVKALANVP